VRAVCLVTAALVPDNAFSSDHYGEGEIMTGSALTTARVFGDNQAGGGGRGMTRRRWFVMGR
jgi:hypothetical protein